MKKKTGIIAILIAGSVFVIILFILFGAGARNNLIFSKPETIEKSKKENIVTTVSMKKPEEINTKKSFTTLDEIKKEFTKIDEIVLFNGRVIQGAITNKSDTYTILTVDGNVAVKETDVKCHRILK